MNKFIKPFSMIIAVMLLSVSVISQTVQVSADNEKSSEVIDFGNNFQVKMGYEEASSQIQEIKDEDVYIQWGSGIHNYSLIGPPNGSIWYIASRWRPSDLTPYDGLYMNSITFFPFGYQLANYTLKVWIGENAETEIMSMELPSVVVDFFNEIQLDESVQIDASQEMWFGVEIYQNTGGLSIGIDDGPAVQGFGDLISYDGVSWTDMTSEGFDINWHLAAGLSVTVGDEEIEVLDRNDIAVFPNPANDVINISASIDIRSITVFNSIGQVVFAEKIESNLHKINTSDFDNGMYFLQMETEEGVISKRIVIE